MEKDVYRGGRQELQGRSYRGERYKKDGGREIIEAHDRRYEAEGGRHRGV